MLREAAVETEGEFVEICLQVRGCDGTLVGAAQPAFQQGDDQMNVVKFLTRNLAAGGDDVSMMIISCGFKMIVNREPIGHDHGAWLHIVSNEQLDALPSNRLHATKADSPKSFLGVALHRHKDRCFAFCSAPTGAFFLSAHV